MYTFRAIDHFKFKSAQIFELGNALKVKVSEASNTQTKNLALCCVLLVFVTVMSLLTYGRYSKLEDFVRTQPETILANKAGTPFQYRILPTLAYLGLKPLINSAESRD